jgi:hypothetical protein
MNGPLRLRESGGASGRLLDSASLDRPKHASRLRALELAATAGAFVTTTAGAAAAVKGNSVSALYKSVAMWICIGAVAGGALAFIGSSFFDEPAHSGSGAARPPATPLAVPEPVVPPVTPPAGAEPPSDIAAEPPASPTKAPSPARAVAAPPAPSAVAPVPTPPSVIPGVAQTEREKEAGALANAREAVSRGDTAAAIRTLDNYDATHPNGSLRAESAALRQSVSSRNNGGLKREPMTNTSGTSPFPKQPMGGGSRPSSPN